MDWNNALTLVNGGDTLLGLALLVLGVWYLARRWLRQRRLEEPPSVLTYGSERHNRYHVMLGCPFYTSIPGPTKKPSEWRGASPDTERTP